MGAFTDLLLGGASNFISNGINYAFQNMAANHNYQLAEQSAEKQYQRQLDFWEKQNAYNHPRSQVNRRLAAGLSPVESVDSGNASQLSSVPGNNVAQNGALQFQSQIDLLDSMRTIQDIRNLGKTGSKLDAEVSNLIADGFLKELEKKMREGGLNELAERIKGARLDNERRARENKYLYTPEYYTGQLDTLRENLRIAKANANILSKDSKLYDETGINPARMSKYDMLLINAVNTILQMAGFKDGVKSSFFGELFGD